MPAHVTQGGPLVRGQLLDAPERLDALARAVLLDTPVEEEFDRATRLASRLLDAPVALVSIVDRDRQFFKSQVGLPEPWASQRETPLTHSFCQYVVTSGEVLDVPDAREHVLVRDNRAIEDLRVVSYLGVPLEDPEGNVLGSFCVIDGERREWGVEDRATLADIAEQVRHLIALRVTLGQLEQAARERDDLMVMITHDLKGPVTNIRAAADMVRELPADEQDPFVNVILRAAERMESLVAGLVASERAGIPSRVKAVDLPAVVRDVVRRHPQRHRIELTAPEMGAVATDRDAVIQIVSNLLDDALHRAPEGTEVALRVEVDGDRATIESADAGTVSEDRLAELFEPQERESGRLGLALHIVKRLTAALAGRIDAASDQAGTTVRVELGDLSFRSAD